MKKQANDMAWPIALAVLLFSLWPFGAGAENFVDQALKPARETLEIQRETRKAEDRWAGEKETLEAKFTALEQQKKQLEDQNRKAEALVKEKEATLASLERQMEGLGKTSQEIEPFLRVIFHRLGQSVSEDPPFLAGERKARLEKLDAVLKDGFLPISEKFRRLTEALLVEAEYGQTIEVYPQGLTLDGKTLEMNILRLGRLALFCQSPDGRISGYFDLARGKWLTLPEAYNRDLGNALDIASKRRPAELVTLPLGRMAVP